MHDLLFAPWDVSETDFPGVGTLSEKLRFLANYAVLAPSSHNSQPWIFDVEDDRLDLYADRTRVLPVMDPYDRELAISCGAALFFLRLAARHFGYEDIVEILPQADRPDLLARVHIRSGYQPTSEENLQFAGIFARRTNRKKFEDRPIPDSLAEAMQRDAIGEGVELCIVSETGVQSSIARLISEADKLQWSDKRFRNELAAWLRPDVSVSYDGMRSEVMEFNDFTSYSVPNIVRTFDLGNGRAAKDHELVSGSPLLAILATGEDTRVAWLATGQALGKILLRAASEGVSASYLNQPIEIASLRANIQAETGCLNYPQLILRMGYGPALAPTTRRNASTVII